MISQSCWPWQGVKGGDHLPSLPQVTRKLARSEGRTPGAPSWQVAFMVVRYHLAVVLKTKPYQVGTRGQLRAEIETLGCRLLPFKMFFPLHLRFCLLIGRHCNLVHFRQFAEAYVRPARHYYKIYQVFLEVHKPSNKVRYLGYLAIYK